MPIDPATGLESSAPPADPPALPPADPPAGKWYSALDADTQAYVTARGLTDKDAITAFSEAYKAHKAAEAFIGAPKEELIRLPKADAPPEAWKPIWKQLGAPDTPEGYDFADVKPAVGELDPKLVDALRATAVENNLPVPAAKALAANVVKYLDAQTAEATRAATEAATASTTALKAAWGANYEANKLIATNAAKAFGVDITGLESRGGHDKVLELWRNIGTKIGEDSFISNQGGGGGGGLLTPADAVRKIEEAKSDEKFTKALLQGGTDEKRQFAEWHQIAYGGTNG